VFLSSCGIYKFNGGSVPAGADTFSVEYFQVRAALADPNYGQLFTESLKDVLLSQTRLSLVEEEGDIQYQGVVETYQIIAVAAQENESSARNRLTISIKVEFMDTTQEDKDKSFTVSQFEDFLSDENFEDVEESLIEEINTKIIQDIFDKTLGDW
jgi:hypothetical protein